MQRRFDHKGSRAVAAAAIIAAAACVRMPAPESRDAPIVSDTARHVHVPAAGAQPSADAQFLQHMIPHHAQALVMTAMVPSRTTRQEIRLMAERIAVSQRDEIAVMQQWLSSRGHAVPAVVAVSGTDASRVDAAHASMPGMLTQQELDALAAARGEAFDRLFLELMIRHHEGALAMVSQLFARGGGQESQMYSIASEVESDQRMEIDRMRQLLAALPSPSPAG